jgi:hypothetical protein
VWVAAPGASAKDGAESSAQPDGETAPIVDQNRIVDPTATVPETSPPESAPGESGTETTPDEPGTETTGVAGEPLDEPGTARTEDVRNDPGYGSAAMQSRQAKQEEASDDCVPSRPPISSMLGLGGSVASDDDTSWGWLVIVIAAGAMAIGMTAFLVRKRRAASGRTEPRGLLETAATMVAIGGGLAGLAIQFIPGIGVNQDPSPEATMVVREVHARITRGEYADRTGAQVQNKTDKREVGNVIWLEIRLVGYRGKRLLLQYGLYDRDKITDGTLLRGTAKQVELLVEDKDAQTSFVPIWVGYPQSQRFEAQFRLLERNQVRQTASTDKMKGSKYRYACPERS